MNSPQPYNPANGTAFYGARFDYNPLTLAPRGLISEPSGTNLAPNSRNEVYVGDTTGGTSSAPATQILNFGGTRFTADGASSSHFIGTPNTASAPSGSTVHTVSAYVRADTASLVQLTTSTNFANANVYANFNLATGAI